MKMIIMKRRFQMRNRWLVISVTLIFCLVMASWLSAQPMRRGAFGPGMGPGWQEWLGLTPEQKSKIEALRKSHQEEMKGLRDKIMDLQKQLREARQDPKADPKKIEGLIDEIFKLRASQMKARIKFQGEMDKVLTKEQKDKLVQARQRMARFMPGQRMFQGMGPWRRAPFFYGPGPMMRHRFFPRWWR
jgi:Spy/CpxP family protein refolding chaperone